MKVEMEVIGSILKTGDLYWKKLTSFFKKSSPVDAEAPNADSDDDL
jgi:hypothetical protein